MTVEWDLPSQSLRFLFPTTEAIEVTEEKVSVSTWYPGLL